MAGLLVTVGPTGGFGCIRGADLALWVSHWYSSERECSFMC